MRVYQLEVFKKEITEFPPETREDIFSLIYRFVAGERLHNKDFKTFKIDKNTKILEFKVKDARGNWRAVSTIVKGNILVFVYAFHKKSQELLEKDKDTIRSRIRRIEI
jgi:phage-related protein